MEGSQNQKMFVWINRFYKWTKTAPLPREEKVFSYPQEVSLKTYETARARMKSGQKEIQEKGGQNFSRGKLKHSWTSNREGGCLWVGPQPTCFKKSTVPDPLIEKKGGMTGTKGGFNEKKPCKKG